LTYSHQHRPTIRQHFVFLILDKFSSSILQWPAQKEIITLISFSIKYLFEGKLKSRGL